MEDLLYMRAEDFTSAQQRQVYAQLRERANTRLKRRRREGNVIYQNKNVSKFLERRGYRYFPKETSVSPSQLKSYLNELLLYVQDRTSTARGIREVKEERLRKFMSPTATHGELVHGVTADELDKLLVSDEFAFMKTLWNYELILEDFSQEIERGHSVDRVLKDFREFINDHDMDYVDFQRKLESNYIIEKKSIDRYMRKHGKN